MGIDFAELYRRDILKLKEEIGQFKTEAYLWRKVDGINNPAGNLALHIIGGLNYLVGTLIGHTGYVRDREKEFSARDVSQEQLITGLDELAVIVHRVLSGLSADEFGADYPLDFLGKNSVHFYMLNFYGHLNYHLGQVNYLRRILG
ncbi:DinB family protein [Mucilaginibacter ginsenosidivorax]|uniref:DinB superfamily protein n=1 Tax=Mucilaginibacter ginsenosidivorax TaxID=862126 RepID=A0A5B8VSS0_9SPHI|nr:DinB family protein [Mucilaginibacter ginsenosidivorax]QEC74647.1 DinB superfamily protein [Mucilaginibacter ginsenosidivorax]